jgi:hypothetical protein
VLHEAGQVAEANIDEIDVLVLDELQDLFRLAEHATSCCGTRRIVAGPVSASGQAPAGADFQANTPMSTRITFRTGAPEQVPEAIVAAIIDAGD